MRRILYLFLALPIFFASCGNEDVPEEPSTDTTNANANIVGADQSVSRLEIPHLNSRYDYICHKLYNGDVNYSLEYDKSNYHARWVAYTYDAKSAQRNWTSRTDAWAAEPFYKSQPQYQVAGDQTFRGYNRGHLVGSAERYYSKEANEQTFYMSNMSPMNGNFNSIYWGEIEDKVRDSWGRTVLTSSSGFYGGTLYVVKGGTLDQQIAKCQVRNGRGEYVDMAVPQYYWIACLFVAKSGAARAIGFWLEHKDYRDESEAFLRNLRRSAACSIDELEQKTGIDFFCNLQDNIENLVESTYNISQWPGL